MWMPLFFLGTLATLACSQTDGITTGVPTGPVTSVSPSQSSQIQQALLSYATSVEHSPQITGIGIALVFDGVAINSQNIAALNPVPTSQSVDWASFANTPPSITSQPTWFSTIGTGLQSSITSLQTSILNDAVNIVRAELGQPSTTIAAVPSATGTSVASPARMGATEGIVGAAAVGFGLLAAAL